jgi:hypothetical protein
VTYVESTNTAPNQNIANPFVLKSLTFDDGSIFTLGGNGLDFHTNSASVPPSITINNSQTINLSNNLTIAFLGPSGNMSTIGGVIHRLGRDDLRGHGWVIKLHCSQQLFGAHEYIRTGLRR